MEESGPSLLYLYAHFRSWRTSETNSRTYSYTFTHLRTHKHAHTCTLWYSSCFFLSLFISASPSPSLTHSPRPLCTLKWQRQFAAFVSALWRPSWLSARLMLTSKRGLILPSPVFRRSLAPYRVQLGCSKQTLQLVSVLPRNEGNIIVSSIVQLLKICPVSLSVCLPPTPTPTRPHPPRHRHSQLLWHVSSPVTIFCDGRQYLCAVKPGIYCRSWSVALRPQKP